MVVMHGLFDLKQGYNEHDFKHAFNELGEHLRECHLLASWRFMRHVEHDGYNADYPGMKFYISMEFVDQKQSLDCWAYVADNREPVKSVHYVVNSMVKNTIFFLSEDININ